VRWPEKFRLAPIEKYDGTANPDEFLQIYTTVVEAAGGTPKVMANYFPTALTGSARSWLMNLPAASICSWEDLCDQFVTNFQGTSARPGEEDDLYQVQQHKGESLRKYIQHFCQCRNTIAKISGESVCIAFRRGVRNRKMAEKLATRVISSPTELFALTDKCARAAEAREWQSGRPDAKEAKAFDPQAGLSSGGKKKKKRKGPAELVAAVEPSAHKPKRDVRPVRRKEGGGADAYCPIHDSRSHDLRDCRVVKSIAEKRGHGPRAPDASEKDGQDDEVADLAFQDADQTIACLHGGASTCSSRRVLKLLRREVCAVTPALEASQPLKWSEVPITFSRADHPENTKGVGRLPIVVTPTIRNIEVGRVLIDGGSGLNILSSRLFERM